MTEFSTTKGSQTILSEKAKELVIKDEYRLCVLTKNDKGNLKEAAKIPLHRIFFCSEQPWVSAEVADFFSHRDISIYFAVSGKGSLPVVEYKARLRRVILTEKLKKMDKKRYDELRLSSYRLDVMPDKELWGKTWYEVVYVRRIPEIPFKRFIKVENNEPVASKYDYGYAICYDPQPEL